MNPYDAVAYPSFPFVQTHPDRLATLALLFGMEPAPVETCRVLELGCGDGANLIPMALELPGSRLLGVDLAAAPIERGQETARRLGLANLELRQADVVELGDGLGEFDYIIAHGLYSWVPPAVQDKVLAIAGRNLAPQGVAFVSYNAYPGSHVRQMLREMLLFHAAGAGTPGGRIERARDMLEVVAAAQAGAGAQAAFLREQCETLLARPHEALYHDELGGVNEPLYFSEFLRRAAAHRLQYLAEAEFHSMQTGRFAPEVAARLSEWSGDDRVALEQYLDFIKCRRFRQTLLCRAGLRLRTEPSAAAVPHLCASSPARAVSPPTDPGSTAVERFETPNGAGMETAHPLAKAAIRHLGEAWPAAVPFAGLLAAISPAAAQEDAAALSEILLRTYAAGLAELHAHRFRFADRPGERPEASPLARLQARSGETVTTLRHTTLRLADPISRNLVTLLDGTRDRPALAAGLAALPDVARSVEEVAAHLDENLYGLARRALLIA